MIDLFVVDVDGCISFPFKQPHWASIEKIRALNKASKKDKKIPPITLLTGRPQPYAECVAQWLGIDLPFIFESGGGLYQLGSNKLCFNPIITQEELHKVQSLKKKIEEDLIPLFPEAYPEFTKHTDCGIVHPDPIAIRTMMPKVLELMESLEMEHFEMHHTEISINVIHKKANKAAGLQWLKEEIGITSLSRVAYIGDSSGDIPALQIAGFSYAPANATIHVRTLPQVQTSTFEATEAIADIYSKIIAYNTSL